jgi:TrmH family RNA methyltransferase
VPNEIITSRDNKWLKAFRSALQGSGPSEGEPIGIEGRKLVEDALAFGLEAQAVLVSQSGEGELPGVLEIAAQSHAGISRNRIFRTTDKLFDAISGTESPQGIAALFGQRVWGLEDTLRDSQTPLVIVMAGVQDPGNIGTIVRSAEAFGATGVIAARGTADPWSPKALRSSAGSALRLPVVRGLAVPVVLAQLKISKVKIIAASARGAASDPVVLASSLKGPAAIFVGSEGSGLPAEVEHSADASIAIPMSTQVESLNAGVAASILLYEAAKLRAPYVRSASTRI